jgi:hypothetical protein
MLKRCRVRVTVAGKGEGGARGQQRPCQHAWAVVARPSAAGGGPVTLAAAAAGGCTAATVLQGAAANKDGLCGTRWTRSTRGWHHPRRGRAQRPGRVRAAPRRPWQTAVTGVARATDSDEKSRCERVEDERKELARLWLRALGRRRSGYCEFRRRLELRRRRNTEREKERRLTASSFKGEDANSQFASALSSSPRKRLRGHARGQC